MWLIQEQSLLFAEVSDMLSAGRGFWICIDGREMITWISLSVSVIAVTSFVCSPLGYVLNLILYLFLDLFLSVFIGWFLGWFLSLFLGTNAFSLIGFISWCWARGFLLLLCHRGLSSFRLVHYGAQLVRYHKCGRMILPSVRQSLLCREEIYILLEVKRRNELLNYLCKSSCSETFTPSTADEAANRSFLFFFWTSLLWSSLIFFTFLGDIVMLFPLGSSLAGSFHVERGLVIGISSSSSSSSSDCSNCNIGPSLCFYPHELVLVPDRLGRCYLEGVFTLDCHRCIQFL